VISVSYDSSSLCLATYFFLLTKPVEYNKFCESIRQLGLFLSVVKLPGE
jgi:hypothetical protein